MTGDTVPSTIHAVNAGTIQKIEMFPGNHCVHIHLDDGHIVILDWNRDTGYLIMNIMEKNK